MYYLKIRLETKGSRKNLSYKR